jgi:ATP-dependent RNA helicase SUPV3L1/SUV3
MVAEIAQDGAVRVENHYVGRLQGFRFFPDTQAEGIHGKAARSAAAQVLARELTMRARRVTAAKNDAFKLNRLGQILWRDEEIGRLEAGDDLLKPVVVVSADDSISAPDKDKVQERLVAWLGETISQRLKPLVDVAAAKDLSGLARGMAFRLSEGLGILRRETVAEEVRALDQPARSQLRSYGVRFGAFNIYFPALLKPAAVELSLRLWVLKCGAASGLDLTNPPELPRAGLTSLVIDPALPEAFYRIGGYHPCGSRAVRIDMLERLADQIRPLVAWRPDPASSNAPPKGATGDGGFRVTSDMMSILGCSSADVGEILHTLGFRLERVPVAPAPVENGRAPEAAEAESASPASAPSPDADGATLGEVAPAEAAATPPEESAREAAEPAPEKSPAEAKWDEIWRPRRQSRQHDRPRRRHGDQAARSQVDARPAPRGKEVWRSRRQRKQDSPPGRGEERQRSYGHSAAPPPKPGIDPDSPFAALSSLKAALERQSQE